MACVEHGTPSNDPMISQICATAENDVLATTITVAGGPIVNVLLAYSKLIVLQEKRIHVFQFPNLCELIRTEEVRCNPTGLATIGCDFNALNNQATLLATGSTKGTVIRIFDKNSVVTRCLMEFRRGADPCTLHCLQFSPCSSFLAVTSDKGTIHIFTLRDSDDARRGLLHKVELTKGERRSSVQISLEPRVLACGFIKGDFTRKRSMSFHDEDYTPQYYDLDTAPGDQDMEYERQVDGKENRVRRNQGAFLSDDSTNVIHRRSQTFYEDMQLATNLNDRRAYVQRKCSSDEKRRKISHESCNSVASTANALPVTNTFSEAVNSITGENSLSLVKLGKLVRQFEMNLENKELLATKMKEVNAINLQQVKSMQNAIDSMRPSSDSVVRTLAGIIEEQSNIIAGLSLTVDVILSNQQEHGKQLRKASYHIAKGNEFTLPAGHVFERKNFTKSWKFNGFPPFKNANMVELFENWTQPSRAHKNDHFLLMMDFYRFYFLHVSEAKISSLY
ncbi:unnamed protein product [Cylicocyclus nassatus]|uniref:Uncharacterized protein n=1 Tax=Cylicocyclus nassatus TaxID=53992 RepID=A0AA36GKL3_CYLNA|nr:unnamed protein product [Cylicocyclus nassatus]